MDFEEDAKVNVSDSDLKELSKLANQQLMVELEIGKLEEATEKYKDVYRILSQIKIPELMQKIGMSSFTLNNGAKIDVQPFYSGKIDETNMEGCAKWLAEKGHGSLMDKDLTIKFGQADGVDWTYIIRKIKELVQESEEIEVDTNLKQGVHHKRLSAFIKERVQSGEEFPLELFKAYIGNKAKITLKG